MALNVEYVFRETVSNLRRDVSMASAALLTVAVSLTLVGGALVSVTSLIQIMLWAIAAVLLAAASVLILNTIRMAIFSRRREVAVMKLVGATNWFIRVPFMLEGLLQGLFGAALAFAVVWVGRDVIQSRIAGARHDIQLTKQVLVTGH